MFVAVRVLILGGLAGKVLGVARELVFAWLFGTGGIAAAWRLAQSAFLIPLQGLVSEAINSAFIPLYAADRKRDPARAGAAFRAMHLVLLVISVAVGVILIAFARQAVVFLAPGFDEQRIVIATSMLRVLACAMPLYVLSALYGAVQLATGGGQMLAARASLQSVGLLAGAVATAVLGSSYWLSIGFLLAYLYLTLGGARFVKGEGLSIALREAWNPEARRAFSQLWRVFIVLIWIPVAIQVNSVIERQVASVVDSHAMAALDYAKFINETLVILIAMPFGLAGLGGLAHLDAEEARALQLRAIRILLYVGVPLAAVIHVHASGIVHLLFQRGAFGPESSRITSEILEAQAIGIWAQLVGYAGTKFLAARGRARMALVSTILGVAASVAVLQAAAAVGPRVLGLASAAQGVVYGLSVLWLLRLARPLLAEMATLALAVGVYVLLRAALSTRGMDNDLVLVAFSGAYWLMALAALPTSRKGLAVEFGRLRSRRARG